MKGLMKGSVLMESAVVKKIIPTASNWGLSGKEFKNVLIYKLLQLLLRVEQNPLSCHCIHEIPQNCKTWSNMS